MKLGEKIKLVRKQRGMTQRELGERLHLDGNAANRIAQYESGFRTPKEGRIQEIARVLNVRKENFFTSAETQEDIIRLMIWYDWEHGCGGSVPIDQAVTKMLSQPFFFVVTPKNGDFDVLFSRSYFTRLSNRFMAVGLFCCRFSTAVRPHCGKNERICR